MKFSEKKKAKMRKIRFKRNKRVYGGIGYCVEGNNKVVDTLRYENNLYLLTTNGDECNIFKVISCREGVVKMSDKRVNQMRTVFEKAELWKEKTKVELTDSGAIKDYQLASSPWEKFGGTIVIFVEA